MAVRQKKARKIPKTSKTSKIKAPAPTFDDALAMLFQLDPGRIEGFEQLSEALGSVYADGSLDPNTAQLIMSAKAQVDRLVQGETSDAEDVLIETSRLLEAASNAREAAVFNEPTAELKDPEAETLHNDSGGSNHHQGS
jgi:hypothetical protein